MIKTKDLPKPVISPRQLIARRMKGGRKVYLMGSNICVGYIFEADGKGAGWFFTIGPRQSRLGSRDRMDKRRFATIVAAKKAMADKL